MTAKERLKIIESLGYTITPEMIAHEEEIDNDSASRKLAEVESIYGANWEQDADSLREILTNGDSMVLNQSGVEQATDPRTEQEIDMDLFADEVNATRASDYPF